MKNGFTLVEVLAVIIILGILTAITVPVVQKSINSSKNKLYDVTVAQIIDGAKQYISENSAFETSLKSSEYGYVSLSDLIAGGYVDEDIKNPKTGDAFDINSSILVIVPSTGNYKYTMITTTPVPLSGNQPVLVTGMTPIKWSEGAWVNTTANDTDWYSYDTTNKKWANAKTADGSMWVWIPRFIYKITSGWHSTTTGSIDIMFSAGTDDTRYGTVTLNNGTGANASNNTWTNNLAFTFGTTELTGIWVAKFEATASEGIASVSYSCDSGDNVITKTVKILPNVQPWRCITMNNAFTVSRNMETNNTYGWGTNGSGIDTHLMKNTEWGAVAYLSKSNYGKGATEIYTNIANYNTGGGSYIALTSQSTTGNIYGIYDMAGGLCEQVSAYVSNGSSYLTDYGPLILSADSKYKDIYTAGSTDSDVNNYALAANKKGDALYETSNGYNSQYSWHDDTALMPSTSNPWFRRGGYFSDGAGAGAFNFTYHFGGTNSATGFRPVLDINAGL